MKPVVILYTPKPKEFDLICQLSEILQAHLSYTIYTNTSTHTLTLTQIHTTILNI